MPEEGVMLIMTRLLVQWWVDGLLFLLSTRPAYPPVLQTSLARLQSTLVNLVGMRICWIVHSEDDFMSEFDGQSMDDILLAAAALAQQGKHTGPGEKMHRCGHTLSSLGTVG